MIAVAPSDRVIPSDHVDPVDRVAPSGHPAPSRHGEVPRRTSPFDRRARAARRHPAVRDIRVLDSEEAAAATHKVHRLMSVWSPSPRDGGDVMAAATLGSALRLDHGRRDGDVRVADGNLVLQRWFGDVLAATRLALSDALGVAVDAPPEGVALPGFEVYGPASQLDAGGTRHCDTQGALLADRIGRPVETGSEWSFTLPVALPEIGATIWGWDPVDGRTADPVAAADPSRPSWVHRYRLGWLALYRGHHVHAVGPVPAEARPRWRITLHGHVAQVGDRTFFYR